MKKILKLHKVASFVCVCVCVCVLCKADSGVGTVYVSDDRGAVFSKSLERHLYATTGSDTDFTAITSLRGVYMTSVLTEGESTLCLMCTVMFNKNLLVIFCHFVYM